MKLLVDTEKLEALGTVTAAQAAAIRRAGAAETVSLAVNAILSLGVIDVVAGARCSRAPGRWPCWAAASRSPDF